MSKITKIEITNYRSIKYLELNPTELGAVLKGKNGVGKTSVIEALYFLFSGKLFDGRAKLGDQNIIPNGADKNTKTTVTATFDNGFTFSGTYWEKWNKEDTLVASNENVFEVNGAVVKKVGDAYSALYQQLGIIDLEHHFSKDPQLKPTDLVRLFYDLGYIKEIDYKVLRAIVIDMVGDIDYLDIIKENELKYGKLKPTLALHQNDLEATKQALRGSKFGTPKTPSGILTDIDTLEKQVNDFNNKANQTVDTLEIETAKNEINTLEAKKVELEVSKSKGTTELTKDLDLKIAQKELELSNHLQQVREKHAKDTQDVITKNKAFEGMLDSTKQSLANVKQELLELSTKITQIENDKSKVLQTISNKKSSLEYAKVKHEDIVKSYNQEKSPTSERITAPISKEQFFLHEAVEYAEIRNKKLAELTTQGKASRENMNSIEEGIKTLNLEVVELDKTLLDLITKRNTLDIKIETLETQLRKESETLSTTLIKLPTLDLNTELATSIGVEIQNLKNDKSALLSQVTNRIDNIDAQINSIQNEIQEKRLTANKELMVEQYRKDAQQKSIELENKKKELVNVDYLLTLIKELEKDKFTRIDEKVLDKFGSDIKFKLFDYNLGDESVNTRLCDLLVKDGYGRFVNIKDLNTGNYPVAALDFLTRVKTHYNVPKSFVFIDEYGTVDTYNRTLLSAFGEQILATEKADDLEIKVDLL